MSSSELNIWGLKLREKSRQEVEIWELIQYFGSVETVRDDNDTQGECKH